MNNVNTTTCRPVLLTRTQAARCLDCSRLTIYRRLAGGELQSAFPQVSLEERPKRHILPASVQDLILKKSELTNAWSRWDVRSARWSWLASTVVEGRSTKGHLRSRAVGKGLRR